MDCGERWLLRRRYLEMSSHIHIGGPWATSRIQFLMRSTSLRSRPQKPTSKNAIFVGSMVLLSACFEK